MINLFPKLQDNQYNRQSWGGLLFLITIICIVVFIWAEITNALQGTIQLQVDPAIDSRIRVNLDAVIQAPCQALTLNIQDMMGSYLQDVQHTMIKTRIVDENLEYVDVKQNINFTSCYGAELLIDQKCYSCQDVMMAFAQRRWRQPNFESIVQCVGKPTVQFDDSELKQFRQADLNHQKELQLTKKELVNVTATELFKQSIEVDDEEEDATEQIMTQEQRDKFKKALGQLSEISYNPMQWDEQRLKQEKGKQIDQLIGMLNISLDHIGGTLASQLRFSDRERVLPFKNLTQDVKLLTEIYRQKCETTLKIYLNASYDNESKVENFELDMPKDQCSIPFYYSAKDDIMTIQVQNYEIQWKINTSVMMSQFVFFIEKLLVINEEYNYNYQPNSMLDRAYNQFRISVYVHVKQIKNPITKNSRLLFSESFQVEQPSESYIEVSDIEEHIDEACRFFGYFYIKKVPGVFAIQSNKPAMELINRTFQGNHTFKLSFGDQTSTQRETYSQFSSKYYLKLVTTNNIDIWNNQNVFYTFTQQRSLYNETIAPFIEFQYEFDPISMTIQSTSITNYLVIVFAVIGGVFAVSKYIAGILNMLI
ncbi:unnamed protein product [Paramecium octaurelia]|uniref:Uncharacterized protein n=1 Tax=Paramecium octaurelia TaxID=43137 RepID=A0A8S1W175_PAROT|nr:unnamed protein product [Paramecium octaurelia]